MAQLPVLWEGLLENEATEREAELRDVMGKTDSQGYIFEPLDPAVPEVEHFKKHFKKAGFVKNDASWSFFLLQIKDSRVGAQWEVQGRGARLRCRARGSPPPAQGTDLGSLPLLVGERFSGAVPLFWGEEVVKEFPESEVLPLLRSRPWLRSPPGLSFSGPRDLLELICVEGGEEVSLPESYSWERPRRVASGLAVLVKRSAADPDPVI